MSKKILMIYTGGTIGMVPSPQGYIPSSRALYEQLEAIPDFRHPAMPDYEVVEFHPLLDSSNMTVQEWNKIGQVVADRYDEFDGFVVLHGTDTMAYSASALSFMLEHLSKPVVFTGAQIPLCEIRSDGRDNIINSMLIASSGVVREVCLYFNGKLLRGNRSTKRSSDQLAAFESPNAPILAEAGITIRYRERALRQPEEGPFRFQPFDELPIGVIKVFPGIQFSLFESIMTESLRGVVLETFGAGNIPSGRDSLLPIIQKAYQHGTIIAVCSQCPQGSVTLGTYETSKALHDIGAVNGRDMTTEAAVTKLYYLFSKGHSKEAIQSLMSRDLRGELFETEL